MTAELGHFALILALLMAVVQGVVPLIGAQRRNDTLMALAGPTAIGQFVFVSMAFGCLMYAYVVSDFSVMNVAANSHSDKPLLYKFTAVWGNHEGSMVLWVWILSLFGAGVALFGGNLPLELKSLPALKMVQYEGNPFPPERQSEIDRIFGAMQEAPR